MKKKIAFFDFDGTITTKDTLLEFIKFVKGSWAFYIGFIISSPYLIAYKLKIISNQYAKEKVLKYFFAEMPVTIFYKYCENFAEQKLPALIRPKAIDEFKMLTDKNIPIVIVSASPENWIKPWSDNLNANLIATRLEINNNCLTGKILEVNCYGEEKVRRIKEIYSLPDYNEIFAYGDTKGDLPMLNLANISFYKPFHNK